MKIRKILWPKVQKQSGEMCQELESREPMPIFVPQREDLKNEENVQNTHDWNYDKPYEWGLETLTETTFIKNL